MNKQIRAGSIPSLVGIGFVFLLSSLYFLNAPFIRNTLRSLENWAYDLELRASYKPLPKDSPIAILDIDDQSLQSIGRWPWPRNQLAKLLDKAHQEGAKIVAFDMIFPEPEQNIIDQISSEVADQQLAPLREKFNFDAKFAASLDSQKSILGFVFTNTAKNQGTLPSPIATVTEELANELAIPEEKTYLLNIPILQNAAKNGGFINSTPDPDGVIRFAPLIIRNELKIYPSLALEAAKLYLEPKEVALITNLYRGKPVLEALQLDRVTIPTDPWGRILIPFRGPPYTFPHISAVDLLNDRIPREQVAGKVLFVGLTGVGTGELNSTAIAPIFSGVEIHATIAAGIIENYLPYKPTWGRGAVLLMILILGLICALLFPYLDTIALSSIAVALPLCLVWLNQQFWIRYGMVIYVFFPIFVILVLYVFNLIYGNISNLKKRKEVQSVFGQYVSPEYVEKMLDNDPHLNLEGESKKISILFADIVGFTAISEKLSAPDLKRLLNTYFTPMTEVIFNEHGTIDKYVGDMIMAFWGAPLDNPNHAHLAVKAALSMQKRLKNLNTELKKNDQAEIHIGIGVNTGIVNVGDMGSAYRRAYTVIGDSVNVASRLEAVSRLYNVEVLVGESTWKETQDEFLYRKVDRVRVKGKTVPIDIYEPLCAKTEATKEWIAEVEMHNRAFEFYQKQNWDEAERLFKELAKSEHGALDSLYLNRIEEFRTHLPPNWDGVYNLEAK